MCVHAVCVCGGWSDQNGEDDEKEQVVDEKEEVEDDVDNEDNRDEEQDLLGDEEDVIKTEDEDTLSPSSETQFPSAIEASLARSTEKPKKSVHMVTPLKAGTSGT